MQEKKLYYFLAVKEILELFGEQELCSRCEVNIPAVLQYLESMRFAVDCWRKTTKEEIFQVVTDDILAGYPVWQLLDLPDWKRQMLERELTEKIKRNREELVRTYKCYTCKYFEESVTPSFTTLRCHKPKKKNEWHLERVRAFEPKKECDAYTRKEEGKKGKKRW